MTAAERSAAGRRGSAKARAGQRAAAAEGRAFALAWRDKNRAKFDALYGAGGQ